MKISYSSEPYWLCWGLFKGGPCEPPFDSKNFFMRNFEKKKKKKKKKKMNNNNNK